MVNYNEELKANFQDYSYSDPNTTPFRTFSNIMIAQPLFESFVKNQYGRETGLALYTALRNNGEYASYTMMGGNTLFSNGNPLSKLKFWGKEKNGKVNKPNKDFKTNKKGTTSFGYRNPDKINESLKGVDKFIEDPANQYFESGIGFRKKLDLTSEELEYLKEVLSSGELPEELKDVKNFGYKFHPKYKKIIEEKVDLENSHVKFEKPKIKKIRTENLKNKKLKTEKIPPIKDQIEDFDSSYLEYNDAVSNEKINKKLIDNKKNTKLYKDIYSETYKEKASKEVEKLKRKKKRIQQQVNKRQRNMSAKIKREMPNLSKNVNEEKKYFNTLADRLNKEIDVGPDSDLFLTGKSLYELDDEVVKNILDKKTYKQYKKHQRTYRRHYKKLKDYNDHVIEFNKETYKRVDKIKNIKETIEDLKNGKATYKSFINQVEKGTKESLRKKNFKILTEIKKKTGSTLTSKIFGNKAMMTIAGATSNGPFMALEMALGVAGGIADNSTDEAIEMLVGHRSDFGMREENVVAEDNQIAFQSHFKISQSNNQDLEQIYARQNIAKRYLNDIDPVNIDADLSNKNNFLIFD